MRILVLGGDGYLGWPTSMYFSACWRSINKLFTSFLRVALVSWPKTC